MMNRIALRMQPQKANLRLRWPHILITYIFDAMLKFIVMFLIFSSLAILLAVVLLALTKMADDRYWADVKRYYEEEDENKSQK